MRGQSVNSVVDRIGGLSAISSERVALITANDKVHTRPLSSTRLII